MLSETRQVTIDGRAAEIAPTELPTFVVKGSESEWEFVIEHDTVARYRAGPQPLPSWLEQVVQTLGLEEVDR